MAALAAVGGSRGAWFQASPEPLAQTMAPASRTAAKTVTTGVFQAEAATSVTSADAVRLAQQASFGPSEALISEIQQKGIAGWIDSQLSATGSRYTSGGDDRVHKDMSGTSYCNLAAQKDNDTCWRDYYSSEPLLWDFYRNATTRPDQLRQRVALALHQLLVISAVEVQGTYGLRSYQNNLLDLAFGNYREVLRKVLLSPVMGDYLNGVNNDPIAPNENVARELLQLFSIGTCQLNGDGSLQGGRCTPTYDNQVVRSYAYALTGWTYPKGGTAVWKCGASPDINCSYYGGDLTPAASLRDTVQRSLLSGVTVSAGASASQALDKVLDSVMQHPNIGPFVARRMIQSLVRSAPSAAYVKRVADAFNRGSYTSKNGGTSRTFGAGSKGDLAATVAATLLDSEARSATEVVAAAGHLRAPVLLFTGAVRAMNGSTDGNALGAWWGEALQQHVFRSPSVFSYYPPDYPVAGTQRVGPEFGIHNASAALNRFNYLRFVLDGGDQPPDPTVPKAIGTKLKLANFNSSAADAGALVDRIAAIVLGRPLATEARAKVITAVEWWNSTRAPSDWRTRRIATAAYLVMASPDYQVQR